MFPVLVFMFVVAAIAWLTTVINSFFFNTSRNIVSLIDATRYPSGKVTFKEMQARNVIPYFCSQEDMVIWVKDPAHKERCPSCGVDIFKIYQGKKSTHQSLDGLPPVR